MALQTRFLASCDLRLVPVASSGIIYWVVPVAWRPKISIIIHLFEMNTRLPHENIHLLPSPPSDNNDILFDDDTLGQGSFGT